MISICGIVGSFNSDFDVLDGLRRIKHRGPDAGDVRSIGTAMHGHVRLAIRDVGPQSDQPFQYGPVVLSYVGELWNADALREHLADRGWEFKTNGDTEVVAVALAAYQADALRLLDGMWALAWTDQRSGMTCVARDRLGKVPLYLAGSPGVGWVWTSERKALPAGLQPTVKPVMPGTVGTLRPLGPAFRSFYALADAVETRRRVSGTNEAENVLALLTRGVARRLVSDVPVCCLISGGLDSTAILSLVKERHPNVVAYTAFMDPSSVDLRAAREVAERMGVPLREVEVPYPTEEDVRTAIETIEIPMKAQVEIALLCLPLAKRISEDGFKVVLSGEGADELFGGYGNTARKATSDRSWKDARLAQIEKMGRGNHIRVNKAFMAHGVEPRLPFMERAMVERVLGLGIHGCPPGKGLLKDAVRDFVPPEIVARKKETFQGAGGSSTFLEGLLGGSQVKKYNAMARDLFGGVLPRG